MRMKNLRVSNQSLGYFFSETGKWHRVVKGLPTDAEVIGIQREGGAATYYNNWIFTVRSDQFEDVPDGDLIPFMDVHFESRLENEADQ